MLLGCPRWHPPLKSTELPAQAAAPHPMGLPARGAQALSSFQAPPSPCPTPTPSEPPPVATAPAAPALEVPSTGAPVPGCDLRSHLSEALSTCHFGQSRG
eukprot:12770397-Alexandrium_andersonii.AAC.1